MLVAELLTTKSSLYTIFSRYKLLGYNLRTLSPMACATSLTSLLTGLLKLIKLTEFRLVAVC